MSQLIWDEIGKRNYEAGCDHGVLYLMNGGKYDKGVAWSGLTQVSENPSGGEETKLYADNIPYLSLRSAEELGLSIECYTYPDEFAECDGSNEVVEGVTIHQQERKSFGFSWRTKIGNDLTPDAGYKLHLAYGCSASPSEKNHQSINENVEADTISYDISTIPVSVTGYKPTSKITINSTRIDSAKLAELEKILYGGEDVEPRLPLPDEVLELVGVGG